MEPAPLVGEINVLDVSPPATSIAAHGIAMVIERFEIKGPTSTCSTTRARADTHIRWRIFSIDPVVVGTVDICRRRPPAVPVKDADVVPLRRACRHGRNRATENRERSNSTHCDTSEFTHVHFSFLDLGTGCGLVPWWPRRTRARMFGRTCEPLARFLHSAAQSAKSGDGGTA